VTALLLVCLAASGPGKAAFYAALAQREAGDAEGALADLRALAAEHPDDPFADDAADQVARLLHHELHRPLEALAAYRDLLARWPASRHARHARRAAERLAADLGGDGEGAEPLAALLRLQSTPAMDPAARAAALRRHLAAWPGFAGAGRVRLLLAQALERLGEAEEATRLYAELVGTTPYREVRDRATRALGDLRLAAGDPAGARGAYEVLAASEDPAARLGAAELLERADRVALLQRLLWAALALLALVLLGLVGAIRPWRGLSPLWPPPRETTLLLPLVLAGLAAAALLAEGGRPREVVAILGLGMFMWTWLSAAAVSLRPPRSRLARWAWPGLAALVALCLAWVAVGHHALLPPPGTPP